MCAVLALLLLVLPIAGAALGYARWGAVGGWAGGLAGLALAVALGGAPIAVLAQAERRKRRERGDAL